MAKENFEDILRELKGESEQGIDLGEKIKNVIRRIKGDVEEKAVSYIGELIFSYMKKEGIIDSEELDKFRITNPIYEILTEKFNLKNEPGIRHSYYFFENTTPLSDDIKADIELNKYLEERVDSYVESYNKKHGRNPFEGEFKSFVESLFEIESIKKAVEDYPIDRYMIKRFYDCMRRKHSPSVPSKNREDITKKIQSEISNIDLSDI